MRPLCCKRSLLGLLDMALCWASGLAQPCSLSRSRSASVLDSGLASQRAARRNPKPRVPAILTSLATTSARRPRWIQKLVCAVTQKPFRYSSGPFPPSRLSLSLVASGKDSFGCFSALFRCQPAISFVSPLLQLLLHLRLAALGSLLLLRRRPSTDSAHNDLKDPQKKHGLASSLLFCSPRLQRRQNFSRHGRYTSERREGDARDHARSATQL